MNIDKLAFSGTTYLNVSFSPKWMANLGMSDAQIKVEFDKCKLNEHRAKVGYKVGAILVAITKDLQTQSNIQAKFSLIDTKSASTQTAPEKAIHAAIIKLAEWTGDVMIVGNALKQDVDGDIDGAVWPELDAQSAGVIAALVAEL